MERQDVVKLIAAYTKKAEAIVSALEAAGALTFTEYGDHDINEVLRTFQECFGTTKSSKYDRYAAARLLKKHSLINLLSVIAVLSAKSDQQYCPTVNNVSQLETKMPSVLHFLARNLGEAREVEL